MISQDRYHIRFKGRRTTITVDNIISTLLALKLNTEPGSAEARSRIKQWFEETLQDKLGISVPGGSKVSQWARVFAIEALTEKKLIAQYWEHRLSEPHKEIKKENFL